MADVPPGVFRPAAESAAKVIIMSAIVFVAGFETSRSIQPARADPASMVERGAELIPRLARMEDKINDLSTHLAIVESRVEDLRAHRGAERGAER